MTRSNRPPLLAVLLLLPHLALASVGEVSVLEGTATRTPARGAPVPLKVGSGIEVGDTVKVGRGGNLKLTLTDSSVLMLGESSELVIDEARFQGLDRQGFSARLTLGKLWAKVTKAVAGSDAKFKVSTDRAVAGVRGTIFRVDAVALPDKSRPTFTVVRVAKGRVAVDAARVSKQARNAAPQRLLALAGLPTDKSGKPERHRVPGPTQVSAEEWEKRFTELQARQMVAVGDDLWQEAGGWEPENDRDAFARFVMKQDGLTEASVPKATP